jgi:tetratricopeptide (TPR) repeat protein
MLAALVGESVELNPLKRLIAERTGGNPFFIEEMVQALYDERILVRNGMVKVTRSLSQIHIPPTVQGILAARIDRLSGEQKELLQTLAVIGRESPLGLIREVTVRGEAQLQRMLADLQAAEFIYEQPALTDAEYIFKHALTQEVAYKMRGWAVAKQGGTEGETAQIQEGLAAQRATGAEVTLPYYLSWLAEAYVETGRLDDGLGTLTKALAAADENEDRFWKAEIYRLKGEVLLKQDHSNVAEAQNCFQRAVEIARNQSAKSLELRAATSLARLLDQ